MVYLIKHAKIVNEGRITEGDVLIEDHIIKEINSSISVKSSETKVIDAEGNYLIPGMIDDQVHFREPGLTHKETILTGSKAAVSGGITSFFEMPNTNPQTTTQERFKEKIELAQKGSFANYAFMFGGTNDNLEEIKKIDPHTTPALKLFLGSSTGNMLVDDEKVLKEIFENSPIIISAHCEDEATIKANLDKAIEEFGEEIPISQHPKIRSAEACYISSSKAIKLAEKTGARLHVFHLSTAKEMRLFNGKKKLENKKITAEVCVHHLWFSDEGYEEKGTLIKWNPAVKSPKDRQALLNALKNDKIDVIATDHAPHTLEEKENSYTKAPSGGPLVQHALPVLFEYYHQGVLSLEQIVQKTSHNPAKLFDVEKRGFIKEGYFADLVLVNLNAPWTVNQSNIFYKCGWSPFFGNTFKSRVTHTFVNGHLVYNNFKFSEEMPGQQLKFDR
ncbi:MAG: dihydroorotase [Psychroflexus halocasei]